MPIYEYRCTACDNLFEEWVKSFDSPEHEPCPKCGGDAERVISRTSFVLEGAGWYVTEYGNRKTDHESGAGVPGAGEAPAPDSPATPEGSSDASSSGDTAKEPLSPVSAPTVESSSSSSSSSSDTVAA